MLKRCIEFFQDNVGQLSMAKLLNFWSFFPSTYILVTVSQEHIETVFGIYIGAYMLGFLGGKFTERIHIGSPVPQPAGPVNE